MGRVSTDRQWWMDDFGNIVPYRGQDVAGVTGLTTYSQPMGAEKDTNIIAERYAGQLQAAADAQRGAPSPSLTATLSEDPGLSAASGSPAAMSNIEPQAAPVQLSPTAPGASMPGAAGAAFGQGPLASPPMPQIDPVPPNPLEGEGKFQFRLKAPDGTWKFTRDIGQLDKWIGEGYKVIHNDGTEAKIEQFNGGTLIDGLPANAPLTGSITEDQRTALINGGRWNPEWDTGGSSPLKIVSGTAGGANSSTGNTGDTSAGTASTYFGNQGAGTAGLPDDFKKMLTDLMQRSLDQGTKGQEAFSGVIDDLKNYLAFARSGAEKYTAARDDLTQNLMGRLTPAMDTALANMNTATGLSPEAMSALRVNALESPEYAYQGQASQLKSMLGSRGAYGGETPGSMGDIVRGYGPLLAARDATRSNLLANTILADEQRKFDTLGLNRATGISALGAGNSMLSTIGNIYDPSSFLGANQSALSGLLGATQGYNQAGFQGLTSAAPFANVYGDTQAGSFSSLLKSALAGTAANAATQLPWGDIIKGIGGLFGIGGGNNNQVVTSTVGPIGGWDPNSWRGWDPNAWE